MKHLPSLRVLYQIICIELKIQPLDDNVKLNHINALWMRHMSEPNFTTSSPDYVSVRAVYCNRCNMDENKEASDFY